MPSGRTLFLCSDVLTVLCLGRFLAVLLGSISFSIARSKGSALSPFSNNASAYHLSDSGMSKRDLLRITTGKFGCSFLSVAATCITVDASHVEIKHYRVDEIPVTNLNFCCAIACDQNLVAPSLEQRLLSLKNSRVVVDAKDSGHNLDALLSLTGFTGTCRLSACLYGVTFRVR